MPPHLSVQQLEDIQADALADDLDIDFDRMKLWTADQAIEYFESGGQSDPDALSDAQLRADHVGCAERLQRALEPLPCIGLGAFMPGEDKGVARGCSQLNPGARARLFVLYGVADVAMSTQPWLRCAPSWLEVRLIDLPGHGFRQQQPLPPSSEQGAALDTAALNAERAQLVASLTDEIVAAADGQPFALYGFSFGALLAYVTRSDLEQGCRICALIMCMMSIGTASRGSWASGRRARPAAGARCRCACASPGAARHTASPCRRASLVALSRAMRRASSSGRRRPY